MYTCTNIILVLAFVVPVCVFCVFFPFILDINCLMINVLVQSPLRPYFYFFYLPRRCPLLATFLSVLFCLLSLLISKRLSGLISFCSVYLYKNVYSRFFRARGFIHAPSLSMGSKPWLTYVCERSRRARAPGEKASADLEKASADLDDGATFV